MSLDILLSIATQLEEMATSIRVLVKRSAEDGDVATQQRLCVRCSNWRPITEFMSERPRAAKANLRTACNACSEEHRERTRKYRAAMPAVQRRRDDERDERRPSNGTKRPRGVVRCACGALPYADQMDEHRAVCKEAA